MLKDMVVIFVQMCDRPRSGHSYLRPLTKLHCEQGRHGKWGCSIMIFCCVGVSSVHTVVASQSGTVGRVEMPKVETRTDGDTL